MLKELDVEHPCGKLLVDAATSQEFECGDPGQEGECEITLDFRSENWDASSSTGFVRVYLDGTLQFEQQPSDFIDWTSITLVADECGRHKIDLCLNVLPGNNGWLACFDNVKAECMGVVQTTTSTWGVLKAMYR